jgi:hypothetical protein
LSYGYSSAAFPRMKVALDGRSSKAKLRVAASRAMRKRSVFQRSQPVAQAMAEFLARNSMTPSDARFNTAGQHGCRDQGRRSTTTEQPKRTRRNHALVQVKLIEGVFHAAEKEAIIEKLTDAMVSGDIVGMRSAAQ